MAIFETGPWSAKRLAQSIEKLRARHIKANEALDEYGLKISSKLSGGNTNRQMLEKFNLMSAWVSFMEDKTIPPVYIRGKNPNSIVLPTPTVGTPNDVTFGIENYKGEYIPILVLPNFTPNQNFIEEVSTLLLNPDNKLALRKLIIVRVNKSKVWINFPETSDYNGQKLTVSNTITNPGEFNNLTVYGGITAYSKEPIISTDLINTYNSVLEDIAIELKISY
tara:strand:+ start:3939 stop:4604 length:666 start_codon:yes stop_codon:yes gene_type:complete